MPQFLCTKFSAFKVVLKCDNYFFNREGSETLSKCKITVIPKPNLIQVLL